MAAIVLTDATVSINAQAVSSYVRSVTLDLTQDAPEDTAMGDTSRSYVGGGLKSTGFSLEFNDDFVDNLLDEILWNIYNGGVAVACTVKPTSAANSANNPQYQFNAILVSYSGFGPVGDVAKKTAQFQPTGNVTRAVA